MKKLGLYLEIEQHINIFSIKNFLKNFSIKYQIRS